MATMKNHGPPGFWYTPSYQSAGRPWLATKDLIAASGSGTIRKVEFPYITKNITVTSVVPVEIASAWADGLEAAPAQGYTANPFFVYFGDNETMAGASITTGNDCFDATAAGGAALPAQLALEHYVVVPGTGSVTFDVRTDSVNVCVINWLSGSGFNILTTY